MTTPDAYIELDSTVFRGELKAATGVVKFQLSATAINVVDTVHIVRGAVSYSQYYTFSRSATNGRVFYSLNANIADNQSSFEITCYCNRLGNIYVDGQHQNRHNANKNFFMFPVIVVAVLNKGMHTLTLSANSSGTASGWINLRYIRGTG